ncbi:hypothetical protein L195_g050393, partial [Trifolium pratense]
ILTVLNLDLIVPMMMMFLLKIFGRSEFAASRLLVKNCRIVFIVVVDRFV